jgi:hypothetical protein
MNLARGAMHRRGRVPLGDEWKMKYVPNTASS